ALVRRGAGHGGQFIARPQEACRIGAVRGGFGDATPRAWRHIAENPGPTHLQLRRVSLSRHHGGEDEQKRGERSFHGWFSKNTFCPFDAVTPPKLGHAYWAMEISGRGCAVRALIASERSAPSPLMNCVAPSCP